MFAKILIANRGEIACRVIATAKRMGIATVAIYSDADRHARHVAMADEAVHVGPAPAADSYLQIERIVEAARKSGADAIHPGYGFLSENAAFVDAVEAAGLVFIGPPAAAIRAMGLKDAAKDVLAKAGVPVVPGYHGEKQDAEHLAKEAGRIGYPVMIKARAGGGGKGMRMVEQPADFQAALESAQREAQASFGDPVCLIEKFVAKPRHTEIQIFGDSHGNVIHLFERDCSLQRRHQKVIEEAPAPDMPEAVRAAMGKAAVDAAKAIGYEGAGTVEFIADGSGPLRADGFFFMEMNTRLQVEHPVSEAITGLDFVQLQLRVAAGEALPVTQDDLAIDGWAMEARVYAEDPANGFLPATGRLEHLTFPAGSEFMPGPVRIDSGVRQGDEISPWYDPMIAKLIVHGETRAEALSMLRVALAECHVAGTVTNLDFLGALARHEDFAQGKIDTGLIARDIDALTDKPSPSAPIIAMAAIGSLGLLAPLASDDPWAALTGFRHWETDMRTVDLSFGGEPVSVLIEIRGQDRYTARHGDKTIVFGVKPLGGTAYGMVHDGTTMVLNVVATTSGVSVFADGRGYAFGVRDLLAAEEDQQAGGDAVFAPMPGLVKAIFVGARDQVARGEALLVVEAMKMEHTLTAPRDGTVASIDVAVGDQVTEGARLAGLEPDDG